MHRASRYVCIYGRIPCRHKAYAQHTDTWVYSHIVIDYINTIYIYIHKHTLYNYIYTYYIPHKHKINIFYGVIKKICVILLHFTKFFEHQFRHSARCAKDILSAPRRMEASTSNACRFLRSFPKS